MAQDDRDADVDFGQVLYGADYNPEQWPEDVWDEDVRLMREAHVTTVSVPVFGWASLQPDEETFTFDWLDRVLDKLSAQGVRANLATATASVPAWVTRRYPDVLVVDEDGIRRRHGNRHMFCPSSPNFRRLSTALVREIATRYADHPALQLWHIGNEYGTLCYCDLCADAFRQWLRERHGSLDQLNHNWNTAFWGHTFTDWAQVEPPVSKGERAIQALRIDWHRFASDALLNCLRAEVAVIREVTPNIPITTNLMGAFFPLDYHRWARELDIVSWDNYPRPNDPPETVAFNHALMRGLREGQPFLLMEQSPSQQNWQPYNWIKPPGLLRLQSYQAVAQGADSVMYFQWRRSRGGIEKLHGAVVEHHGHSDARVFREVAELGRELESLGTHTTGGRVAARAAVLFDWPTWWSLRFSSGPSVDLDYLDQCRSVYAALHQLGVQTDVLAPDADLSAYDLIVAPVLTMVEEPVATAISERVRAGATFVATAFTGLVDQHDLVHPGGAPGPLREVLGLTVEETDALPPDRTNAVRLGTDVGTLPAGTELAAGILCERVFLEGAKPVGEYTRDFYAGEPGLTRNSHGEGQAYYLPTLLGGEGLRQLLAALCTEAGIGSPLADGAPPPAGVEVTRRVGPSGAGVLHLLNHGAEAVNVRLRPGVHTDLLTGRSYEGEVPVPHRGVVILTEPTS
ncbi:beta-galactosidase [Actinopolymorpha cephalotaxi]|uniref:Beta-galactosidase n=1 Tax=Actinopolymorpha cephalotaxi TaxID=504797 RepID=A0A1I2LNC9_9ACTN|nr:beta-galactosidase [Actinopolymorpha cephalotaxi]NYH81374.1 beta-galactosidase [Actinopolymorpha cephalotaxi]SFF80814.1 beta-galactosidase [Actinopolymorpha cephalotaxi]